MKTIIYSVLSLAIIIGCSTSKSVSSKTNEKMANIKENDTVRIANDSLEYEITIIDPGFSTWLASTARPEGYYSQNYMENRNIIYVNEWNNRVNQPHRYDPKLYEMPINYQQGIDYGYEVNYKLYNYFIYFQLTYNQRLASFIPRI